MSDPSQAASSASYGDSNEDGTNLTPLQLQELAQQLIDEEASKRPLISESLPISVLREEYERGSGTFLRQIDGLEAQGFKQIRRTRGDGDCFYRSLAFAWIELLLTSSDQYTAVSSALSLLESTLPVLKRAGFQELVYEDFYDILASLIRQILIPNQDGAILTPSALLAAFQDVEASNCIIMYLRLLTSAYIRTDPEAYAPFLLHPETGEDIAPQEFCERFVETCGKEADHVQITVATKALKLNIKVAYLDGRDDQVNFVAFNSNDGDVGVEQTDEPPVLLYRPGHYDILPVKRQEE